MDNAGQPKVVLVNILLIVVTFLVVLLRCLSLRRSRISRHASGRYFLAGVSALYLSLISYFFSYLTNYMPSLDSTYRTYLFYLVVLLQLLNSNASMAALAVAAVATPTAGDDIDSQKIRPSMESLVSSLWLAGLFIYYIFVKKTDDDEASVDTLILFIWALGVARMLLRFFAFQRANASFGVGRNAQLIDGYMAQLQQQQEEEEGPRLALAVPRLILTGEEDQDVEESSQGYRLKEVEGQSSRLVTLDKVWSSRLPSGVKDICLSFSLFKCLRRRFAGYPVAEAGSSWAFRFVCGGLLGQQDDDHLRMFKVISIELDFASDFYYSPIPVVSLGPRSAALHFFLSAFICILTIITILFLVLYYGFYTLVYMPSSDTGGSPQNGDMLMYALGPIIAVVTLYVEIAEMVHSLRSNWTKISMVGHYINQSCWSCIICPCLLRCRPPVLWKDDMRQNLLLSHNEDARDVIIVSPDVKDAVIRSLKSSSGQLSNGVATVRRRCPHLAWACYDRVTTSTDTILVWYIATFLVEVSCSSPAQATTKMAVATSLSRYCAYLVAHAPDLLPGNTAGTKYRYRKVKKCIEEAASLVDYNTSEMTEMGSRLAHQLQVGKEISQLVEEEILNIGSKLGKELVEEERQTEAVWEVLAEFWSEMILYLAPSDNVKGHIESLRRGGELITLLWALLLHAGITSRPGRDVTIP